MTARRTCAVQMLLVALSRRMCCSRVCKASRYAGRKIGRGRPAESERDAKSLRATNCNIGAEFSGRFQQGECENVGGDDNERAGVVRGFDEIRVIVDRTVGRGILNERAEDGLVESEVGEIVNLDFDTERFRSGLDDGDGLRMTIVRDEEFVSSGNCRVTQSHRLSCGGGFIEE